MAEADILITNARVFTSVPEKPYAEAVAVKGNRIMYVGDNQEAEALRGQKTLWIDGRGATLTPGFIDSHFHLLSGAISLATAQLQGIRGPDELKSALQDYARANRTTPWVEGSGLKYNVVFNRQQLDEMIPDRPVYIEAYDGHTAWANTKALEMAGILSAGQEGGPKGLIVRAGDGLATGELREGDAMKAVYALIPTPDANRKRELLGIALRAINAAGVTSAHNMNGDLEELLLYAALEDAGELTLRVYTPYSVHPNTSEADLGEAAEMANIQGAYARGGAVKFFMDGVWESYTALTLEPYADRSEARSSEIYSAEHFTRMAAACDRLGLQIFVHCCGNGAVRRALDGYQALRRLNGERDRRHRVEHIEVIHPDDLPRFRELGVIASMQTGHAPLSSASGDVWLERVGAHRWPFSFAWRLIKEAGARLVLGSDWTVASFDPLASIHAALNRDRWAPGDPDQRLTLAEVILGHTRDAAYAEFQEHQKGQLQAGTLADLVLFSEDLFTVPRAELRRARTVLTIVDGRIVFEA